MVECRSEIRRENMLREQQIGSQGYNVAYPPLPQNSCNPIQKLPTQDHSCSRPRQSPKHNLGITAPLTHSAPQPTLNQQVNTVQSMPIQQSQQSQPWTQQMMYPQQTYTLPPPMPGYYMYPPMNPMPIAMSQPQPDLSKNLNSAQMNPLSPTYNRGYNPRQMSPSHSISDYSNHGERRFSYDPELSPVIHV